MDRPLASVLRSGPRRAAGSGLAWWIAVLSFPLVTQARSGTGPVDVVGRDSLLLAQAFATTRFDSAFRVVGEHAAAARRAGNRVSLGKLLALQGLALGAKGEVLRARPLLDEAQSIAEATRDSFQLLRLLRGRAYAAGVLGLLEEQHRVASHMLAIARATGDLRFQAVADNFIGWIALQRGDLRRARAHLERTVLAQRRLGIEPDEAVALTALGAALMGLGEFDAARGVFLRQIVLARRHGIGWLEAQAETGLGILEDRVGDPARGLAHYRRAYESHRSRGETSDGVNALLTLAYAERAMGRYSSARDLARQGLETCERLGFRRERASCIGEIALNEEQLGLRDAAEAGFRAVMALGDTARVATRTAAVLGLARCLAAQGRPEGALALLEREEHELVSRGARDNVSQLRRGLGVRLHLAGRHAEAARLGRLIAEEAEPLGLDDEARVGWQIVARAEWSLGRLEPAARAFERATSAWERHRRKASDPQWRETRGSEGMNLGLGHAFVFLADSTLDEITRHRRAYRVLERFKTRTLLERMAGPRPAALESTAVAVPSDLETLQGRTLREGEALCEWFVGNDTTMLFVVTRDRCRLFGLPAEKRLALVARLSRDLLATPPRTPAESGAAEEVARRLPAMVFGGGLDAIRSARTLIVSPDGPLHMIPFAALAAPEGPNAVAPEVRVVPSGSILVELRRRAAARRGVEVPARVLALDGGGPDGETRLAGARREVEWLARTYRDVENGVGDRDLPALGWPDLGGVGAVHFAGHTRIDDQSPWRSGLVIDEPAAERAGERPGPGRRLRADSSSGVRTAADSLPARADTTRILSVPSAPWLLRAEQIAATSLPVRLVVLSSCETATARMTTGEGVASLASAFLAAGAPTVVATLWPVDDRATEQLMRVFYGELERGAGAAAALRTAQARLRARPETRSPYYWAGFVLVGDGDTRLPLRARPFSSAGVAVYPLLLLAVAITGWLAWRRRPARGV